MLALFSGTFLRGSDCTVVIRNIVREIHFVTTINNKKTGKNHYAWYRSIFSTPLNDIRGETK